MSIIATLIALGLGLGVQSGPPAAGWTWTLYEGDGPVVLAHEIPDTPRLRATLECTPGTGSARIAFYGVDLASGYATVSAGDGSAMSQASASGERVSLAVPTGHPVFGRFVADGALDVRVGEARAAIEIPAAHLAKLRRFAELCGG